MPTRFVVRKPRDLGAAVAEARRLRGMSQEELARATGVDRTYLARVEAGLSVLLVARVLRLLRRLGAEVVVLLPDDEEPHGRP